MRDREAISALHARVREDPEWAAQHFFYGALLTPEGLPAALVAAMRQAGVADTPLVIEGDPLQWLSAPLAPAAAASRGHARAWLLLAEPRDRYFHDHLGEWRSRVDEGDIVLCLGLFAIPSGGRRPETAPLAADFVRGAERAGFESLLDADFGARADTWLAALGAVAQSGAPACQRRLERLRAGALTCRLIGLRAARAPLFRVATLSMDDYGEVAALFRRVFQTELTPARWEWKYGGGRGQGMLARAGSQLAGFYGGVTRPIRFLGAADQAVQICDVMVDSGMRGVLTRRGAMFVCASTFLEQYIGYGARHLLGFGFPTERAMRAAERQGLYGEVGRMVELSWPARDRTPRLTRLEAVGDESFASVIDGLWERMAEGMRELIVGVRDWRYVQHRYLRHPDRKYQLYLVRGRITGRPLAVLAARIDEGRLELLDLVGPSAHMPAAIAWGRYLAARAGASDAYLWVSRAHQGRLRGPEGAVRVLDIRNPTSVWSHGPAPESILDRWWFTGGDTDFR